MKIAVFFIIVGISSCFVDAQNTVDCKLKMDRGQAYGLGYEVVAFLRQYEEMTKDGNQCMVYHFWTTVMYTIQLMAGATHCPYETIACLTVSCLPAQWKSQAAEIEKALVNREYMTLQAMGFSEGDMVWTCLCTLEKLMSAHGHNMNNMLEIVIVSLAPTMMNIESLLTCLKNVGGVKLDLAVKIVNGATCLVSKTVTTVIGGGLNVVTQQIPDHLNNLLGSAIAGPILADIAGVLGAIGAVTAAIGGTLGGLSGTFGEGRFGTLGGGRFGTLGGRVSGTPGEGLSRTHVGGLLP